MTALIICVSIYLVLCYPSLVVLMDKRLGTHMQCTQFGFHDWSHKMETKQLGNGQISLGKSCKRCGKVKSIVQL